jgi:hypothetical protein
MSTDFTLSIPQKCSYAKDFTDALNTVDLCAATSPPTISTSVELKGDKFSIT